MFLITHFHYNNAGQSLKYNLYSYDHDGERFLNVVLETFEQSCILHTKTLLRSSWIRHVNRLILMGSIKDKYNSQYFKVLCYQQGHNKNFSGDILLRSILKITWKRFNKHLNQNVPWWLLTIGQNSSLFNLLQLLAPIITILCYFLVCSWIFWTGKWHVLPARILGECWQSELALHSALAEGVIVDWSSGCVTELL